VSLPGGTVKLLFTDIEGSTRLLDELGAAYTDALAEHRRRIRDAVALHGGVEVDTQGDAFLCVFRSAREAVLAATAAQTALAETPVRVRMGIHTGEPTLTDEGYVGLDVHRGARICAAAHGAQIMVSSTTRELLDGIPFWLTLLDKWFAHAHESLPVAEGSVAWEAGRSLSFERAVEEALEPPNAT
jgi:class 3 adenylate cyclase